MAKSTIEPLLTEDDNRYVMFPIQHDDIWSMYKKQIDCLKEIKERIENHIHFYLYNFHSIPNAKFDRIEFIKN